MVAGEKRSCGRSRKEPEGVRSQYRARSTHLHVPPREVGVGLEHQSDDAAHDRRRVRGADGNVLALALSHRLRHDVVGREGIRRNQKEFEGIRKEKERLSPAPRRGWTRTHCRRRAR